MNKSKLNTTGLNIFKFQLLAIVCLVSFQNSFAQETFDCNLLRLLMNHKKLQDVYVFKIIKTSEITFVNSTPYQFTCELGSMFNKSILIKNDSTLAKSQKEGHYLIDRVLINDRKIEMDISYKKTGLKGTVYFVRKGSQKYKIARYDFGFF